MAVLKLTSVVSSIQGKVNGSLFGNTGQSKYIRNKTTPVNKVSKSQGKQRQFIGALTRSWRSLSEDQRLQWNNFASKHKTSNRVSDDIYITGFNWYVKLNSNLRLINQSLISVPPLSLVAPSVNIDFSIGVFSAQFVVIRTVEPIPIGYSYAFFATTALSSGVHVKENQFKHFFTSDFVGSSSFPFYTTYTSVFGRVGAVGGAIWVRVKVISKSTGAVYKSTVFKTRIVF